MSAWLTRNGGFDGGISLLDIDGLMKRSAETAAAAVKKWAAGQQLEETQ